MPSFDFRDLEFLALLALARVPKKKAIKIADLTKILITAAHWPGIFITPRMVSDALVRLDKEGCVCFISRGARGRDERYAAINDAGRVVLVSGIEQRMATERAVQRLNDRAW